MSEEPLYHFTSVPGYNGIIADGLIRVTESNIGSPFPDWLPYGEHVGPDVVWLTDVEPEGDGFAQGLDIKSVWPDAPSKTDVKIVVAADDAQWWPDFAVKHGINPQWRHRLEKGRDPQTWWVVEREILISEFVGYQFAEHVRLVEEAP